MLSSCFHSKLPLKLDLGNCFCLTGRKMNLKIIAGGLDDPRVLALLRFHIEAAKLPDAPQSNHAFSADELKHPAVKFWSAWDDDTLMGTAALHLLDKTHAEVKSMHVVEAAR